MDDGYQVSGNALVDEGKKCVIHRLFCVKSSKADANPPRIDATKPLVSAASKFNFIQHPTV